MLSRKEESDLKPEDLWPVSRVQGGAMGWLFLALYLPFGVLMMVWRGCILLTGSACAIIFPTALHGKFIRGLCAMCGVIIMIEGQENVAPERGDGGVIVANHVCNYDPLPMRCLAPISVLVLEKYRNMPLVGPIFRTLVPVFMGSTAKDRAQMKTVLKDHCTHQAAAPTLTPRLVVFPEGALTNGQGVMQFSKYVFSLGVPVYPVVLSVRRPFAPWALDTLSGTAFTNLLWLVFCPLVIWKVKALPAELRKSGETDAAFAKRVQRVLAAELDVPATNYSLKDKAAFAETMGVRRQATAAPSSSSAATVSAGGAPTQTKRGQLIERLKKQKYS